LPSIRDLNDVCTLLRGEMRVATTDEHARRWFRRCWTFGIGSGAHVLVNGVIERPEMTPKPLARERPRRPQADLHCIP
jgi:hypothetical protein